MVKRTKTIGEIFDEGIALDAAARRAVRHALRKRAGPGTRPERKRGPTAKPAQRTPSEVVRDRRAISAAVRRATKAAAARPRSGSAKTKGGRRAA